jgi:hypothetical protein
MRQLALLPNRPQYDERRYTARAISAFRVFMISGGVKPIFLNPDKVGYFVKTKIFDMRLD